MSIDTHGFVPIDHEPTLNDAQLVIQTIEKFIRTLPKNSEKEGRMKSISSDFAVFCQMFNITFWDGDDRRSMSVHFDCHSDYSDVYDGKKIIISLGCWGRSKMIVHDCIKAIQTALSSTDAFFQENDCDSKWVNLKDYHL